ncbi:MAG: DNA mismatch repair protein MutS [Winogradskyella sp.]|nr:DNA mismatch repair protein MutS [Winogradskyella sp.]
MTSIDPQKYYSNNLKDYNGQSKDISKRLLLFSVLRAIVFVGTATGIYVCSHTPKTALIVALIGVGIFLWLVKRYTNLKSKSRLVKTLIEINEEELKISKKAFYHRKNGLEYLNSNHEYSLDIDLFGKGSFFQYINRTATKEGTDVLSNYLLSNDTSQIKERQDAICELSSKQHWSQTFAATAMQIQTDQSNQLILNWLKSYKPFLKGTIRLVPPLFSLISVALIAIAIYGLISVEVIGYWLLVGLAITGIYLKRINTLSFNTSKAIETFKQYGSLLEHIENQTFDCILLKSQQQQLIKESKKASEIIKLFSKRLDALDNRNNLISAILGNGYLLWDIMQSYQIEKWITTHGHRVEHWFNTVSIFDAYNTLGTYAFNHPKYTFPKIVNTDYVIEAKDLGHPLLDEADRISSDLVISKQQFFIVTGANMAGKSTFLRTVSLHIIMANMGLPVCAKESNYNPTKLITSMRTDDSLDEGSSYFFSELKRLKYIIDHIEDSNYFVVLDEILKGTNSTDKAIGSRKFVERLIESGATGIIATHDLSLCKIETDFEAVENYFFDAEIVEDELYFDYKLKKGICQNMNASFLLKKLNIIK